MKNTRAASDAKVSPMTSTPSGPALLGSGVSGPQLSGLGAGFVSTRVWPQTFAEEPRMPEKRSYICAWLFKASQP